MRFAPSALIYLAGLSCLFAECVAVEGGDFKPPQGFGQDHKGNDAEMANKETGEYWERFLQMDVVSFQTTPPSPGPSQAPSRSPSAEPSPSPSSTPTSAPSSSPTSSPSSSPSSSPTSAPSSSPTSAPSSAPSAAPSAAPTAAPSAAPSPAPSAAPSPAPSGVCDVTAEILCVNGDGVACDAVPPPEFQCSNGGPVSTLTLQYTACTCDESRNGQTEPEEFACQDGVTPGDQVNVVCQDADSNQLFSGVLSDSDTFTVNGLNGGTLPERLTCSVELNNNEVQTITFDTSGTAPLFLQDKFGSFLVLACDDQDCIEDLTYTYQLTNTGQIDMDITVVRRTRDGETENLVDLFNPPFVAVGDTISATETVATDFCVDATYITEIDVEADPQDGSPCFDNATYVIDVDVSCRVDVEIECVDENGVDCVDIPDPDITCSDGDDMTEMRFSYTACTCDESRNSQGESATCQDVDPTLLGEPVVVNCVGGDGSTLLSDTTVQPDETFTVSAPAGQVLPDSITCTMSSPSGEVVQINTLDVSGDVTLMLTDKYGSMQVEACSDNTGEELDCLSTITYTYNFENIGTNDMDITVAEYTRGNTTVDLLPLIPDTDLAPGESTSVSETETLDLCESEIYTTVLTAAADPPNNLTCFDEDTYTFDVEVGCLVDVEISCVDENGVDCAESPPQDLVCNDGDEMTEMRFKYTPCNCEEDRNVQGESSVCEDVDATLLGEPVVVSCVAPDGTTLLEDTTVQPDETFTVSGINGQVLPDSITCTMTSTSGAVVQVNTLDVSGDVGLGLGDKFGSLEVEACRDDTGEFLDCLRTVTYTYDLENVGTSDMDITEMERTRNGETIPLLDQLPVTNLVPGQSISLTESDVIDFCEPELYTTTVSVAADPPNGITCFDEDEYSFEVDVSCRVDVEIECVDQNGVDCSELDVPEGSCSDGDELTSLRFRYTACTCEEDSNTQNELSVCEDLGEGLGEAVVVTCTAPDGSEVLPATTVAPDETFVVSLPNNEVLPERISCLLTTPAGSSVQLNAFDVSGNVDLQLKDKFGSLELEACSDDTGSTLDCLSDLTYTYSFENVGSSDMDITVLNRTRGDETADLLGLLPDTDLAPGESATATETETVDLCEPGTYSTTVVAEADPPNGVTCLDEDTYEFQIQPECDVDVELECQTTGGTECSDLVGEEFPQCRCDSCATQMIFRYTANPCDVGNVGSGGLLSCTDVAPPMAMADLLISDQNTVFFDGLVEIGTDVVVSADGGCLPDQLFVFVNAPNSGDNPESNQLLTLDSSCSGSGITLLDAFGAVDFVGYTCQGDAVPHNCFVDVEYTYCVKNVGEVNLNITELERYIQNERFDLRSSLNPDQLELTPTEELKLAEPPIEVELCSTGQYRANVSVVATNPQQVPCEDEDTYSFDISTGTPFPSPSPSAAPSPAPSSSPSASPSATPSASPSAAPSASPSSSPSFSPSASPSASPSSSPSASPSAAPSASPSAAPSAAPSASPSASPTVATPVPSAAPTDACDLDLSLACETAEADSEECALVTDVVEPCRGRPFGMVFRYNGGDCSQSFNIQPASLFQCEDYQGGPPTAEGAESYIVVTDIRGRGIIYHEGWVAVGEEFELDDGGETFESNQNITIYSSNITEPSNILQTVIYHSSCSRNLFLKDRYGASQLVIFINNEQGIVSCFRNATFDFTIQIPIDIVGGPATLTSLISITNFGIFNLTDKVFGMVVDGGDLIVVSQPVVLDLSVRMRYTAVTTIEGFNSDGAICQGRDVFTFLAGNPLPPIFPTLAPTSSPTGTPFPTPDPLTTRCDLEGRIRCGVIDGAPGKTCRNLDSPDALTCTGGVPPTFLQFRYQGNPCPDVAVGYDCRDRNGGPNFNQNVVITAGPQGNAVRFEVAQGGFFAISAGAGSQFQDEVTIFIFTEDGNTELQRLILNIGCNPGDDLTLLNVYGGVQFTGYDQLGSEQRSIAVVEMQYGVLNDGALASVAQSALLNSFNSGSQELITSDLTLARAEEVTLFTETITFNLVEEGDINETFTSSLEVSGDTIAGGRTCSDTTSFSFTIF